MNNEIPEYGIDCIIDASIEGSFTLPEHMDAIVRAACHAAGIEDQATCCVRFAPDEIIREFNKNWRGIDKVTDVLSFPMQDPDSINMGESLGDIALAMPFVQVEADRLDLPLAAHIAHLLIHATLHLLGHDHIDDEEAEDMQLLERQAMHQLGLHDPYPETETET